MAFGLFHVWLLLEGEGKTSFSLPSAFHPIRFYLNLFSIDFSVVFYHGSKSLCRIFPSFSLTYKYNHTSWGTKSSTHSSPSWFWLKIFSFPWIHGITHDYVLQASSHRNERKTTPRSSLDLTLTQHFHDEDCELWEMSPFFEVEPSQTWYYQISSNFRTLVILLQVNLVSSNERKTECEGFYETKNISIFAWSPIPYVGHNCWLHGSTC